MQAQRWRQTCSDIQTRLNSRVKNFKLSIEPGEASSSDTLSGIDPVDAAYVLEFVHSLLATTKFHCLSVVYHFIANTAALLSQDCVEWGEQRIGKKIRRSAADRTKSLYEMLHRIVRACVFVSMCVVCVCAHFTQFMK